MKLQDLNESKINVMRNQDLSPNLLKQYRERAAAERKAGGSIEINYSIPDINITLSDEEVYHFSEHEAWELLGDVPENISAEDFILASAQSW